MYLVSRTAVQELRGFRVSGLEFCIMGEVHAFRVSGLTDMGFWGSQCGLTAQGIKA